MIATLQMWAVSIVGLAAFVALLTTVIYFWTGGRGWGR